MTQIRQKFKYINQIPDAFDPNSKNVLLDINLKKEDLFNEYDQQLKFPYFGRNFHALYDLLSDLYWITNKPVFIFHKGLPDLSPENLRIYLIYLLDSLGWANSKNKELIICFLKKDELKILQLTDNYKSVQELSKMK